MRARLIILGYVKSVHIKPDPFKRIVVTSNLNDFDLYFYNEQKNKIPNMFEGDVVYVEADIKEKLNLEGVYIKKVVRSEQI